MTDESEMQLKQDRDRAETYTRQTLRDLASNLFRVSRGSGTPYDLPRQLRECLEMLSEYRSAFDMHPDSQKLAGWLSVVDHERSRLADKADPNGLERNDGFDMVVKGALQMAASRLVHQTYQEDRGRSEVISGLDLIRPRPKAPR